MEHHAVKHCIICASTAPHRLSPLCTTPVRNWYFSLARQWME